MIDFYINIWCLKYPSIKNIIGNWENLSNARQGDIKRITSLKSNVCIYLKNVRM